jgi:hypothetical protein
METPRPIRYLLWQSTVLLRIASLLVPKAQRHEWYEERHAEVWHWIHFLHESGRLNSASKLELAKRMWGAFPDAAWRRWNRERTLQLAHELPRTPRFCLYAISVFLLAIVLGTGFAPTIRSEFSRLPFREADRLAELSFHGSFIHFHSDNLFRTVRQWNTTSKTAEAIAGYSWDDTSISSYRGALPVITARVSPDFFEVLGNNAAAGRLFHLGDEGDCAKCIVISHDLWVSGFHRDPSVVGKQVEFYDGLSKVIGVLPSNFHFISPEISVWTVTQPNSTKFNFSSRTGMVMRLRPGVSLEDGAKEFEKLVKDAGSTFGFAGAEVNSLKSSVHQGMKIYLVFTVLALLGSTTLLVSRFSRVRSGKPRLGLREYSHWWNFFAAKTALLLAACFIASLEITHAFSIMATGVVLPIVGPASTWLFLVGTSIAVSWSLRDQCRRCRACLKRLGHEANVGMPSYLLLEWWGTELVCPDGHGILHVAEGKTSWLEGDEWIALDDSWKTLFDSEQERIGRSGDR